MQTTVQQIILTAQPTATVTVTATTIILVPMTNIDFTIPNWALCAGLGLLLIIVLLATGLLLAVMRQHK
jgi:hypothetical protein